MKATAARPYELFSPQPEAGNARRFLRSRLTCSAFFIMLPRRPTTRTHALNSGRRFRTFSALGCFLFRFKAIRSRHSEIHHLHYTRSFNSLTMRFSHPFLATISLFLAVNAAPAAVRLPSYSSMLFILTTTLLLRKAKLLSTGLQLRPVSTGLQLQPVRRAS